MSKRKRKAKAKAKVVEIVESWRWADIPARTRQLLEMLTYKRPHGSKTVLEWVEKYVLPTGAKQCTFSDNYILDIGDNPVTMFCAHVDTVHRDDGIQKIVYEPDIGLIGKDDGVCLGADDGTGVWILLGLIEAKIPGRYVFHVGEERGGIGSGMLAYTNDSHKWFTGIKHAIAFDRRGVDDVVTHQMCGRCCSDAFALELSSQLGMTYRPDTGGVFTDTAQYTHIVPECTNVSVGYEHEHTGKETQDMWHLEKLMAACLKVDWGSLPAERDPTIIEDDGLYGFGGYEFGHSGVNSGNSYNFYSTKAGRESKWVKPTRLSREDIATMVYVEPELAIHLLSILQPIECDLTDAINAMQEEPSEDDEGTGINSVPY